MNFSRLIKPQDWPISTKITLFSLTIGIGSLAVMGSLQSSSISNSVIERQTYLLNAVVEERANRIESAFEFVQDQVAGMSIDNRMSDAMKDINAGFKDLENLDMPEKQVTQKLNEFYDSEFQPRMNNAGQSYRGARTYLPSSKSGKLAQILYITDNPTPVGSKLDYERAPQDIAYNRSHAEYHEFATRYLNILGAYDIFLINNNGDIVYSVFKEVDYATNLLDGPYASTDLGNAFRDAQSSAPGEVSATDFRFYEPSYGASAIFFSAPVFDNGERIGVVCAQLPLQSMFDTILATKVGETGTVHIIGEDKKIRSVLPNSNDVMLETVMDTDLARAAIEQSRSDVIGSDMTGTPSLGFYQSLDVAGLPWSIVGEINLSEVLAPATAMRRTLITQTLISASLIFIFAIFFSRSLAKPISGLVKHINILASGDFTTLIQEKRKDEIGQLGSAMDEMSIQIGEMISKVTSTAHDVAGAATEIASTAEHMADGLQSQETQTNEVSAAIEEVSCSVIGIAEKSVDANTAAKQSGDDAVSGSEVVNDAISEIKGIAQQINHAVDAVTLLGDKSEKISDIISVINDIADQTNLLALNAAIEAARAGEHGRGFAVVADEVRKLAERTQNATEEVGSSIREIQGDTRLVITRIEQGAGGVESGVQKAQAAGVSLDQIGDASRTLLTRINEITHAVEEQKLAVGQIAESTETIANVTKESANAASQAALAAGDLSEQSEQLLALTSQFKV